MNALDDLAALVRLEGFGVQNVDWTRVESRLGVVLPRTFKEYVVRFPPGEFQTYLSVEQPRSVADTEGYPAPVRDIQRQ